MKNKIFRLLYILIAMLLVFTATYYKIKFNNNNIDAFYTNDSVIYNSKNDTANEELDHRFYLEKKYHDMITERKELVDKYRKGEYGFKMKKRVVEEYPDIDVSKLSIDELDSLILVERRRYDNLIMPNRGHPNPELFEQR